MALHSIERLSKSIQKLPGIGEKTAFRMAMHLFYAEKELREEFANALIHVDDNIQFCKKCFNITTHDLCEICNDNARDAKTLCVVEEYIDLIAIEQTNEYTGVYHVLHGLINPLKGVSLHDIRLDELFARVQTDNVQEVILAFDAGLPGDTTANYIYKFMKERDIKTTRIAYGISLGSDIENADSRSLARSIHDRTLFE